MPLEMDFRAPGIWPQDEGPQHPLSLLPEEGILGDSWAGLHFGPNPTQLPFPELDFGAITLNSMDATSERDFVGECWGLLYDASFATSPGVSPL